MKSHATQCRVEVARRVESGGDRRWNVLSIVLCRYTVDTPRPGENEAPRGPPSVCDCIIYPLSLLYAAINSVYTPGKVFPKHRRAWLPAYPLSILLCLDIVHLPTPTPIPGTPYHHGSPSPPHSFIPIPLLLCRHPHPRIPSFTRR